MDIKYEILQKNLDTNDLKPMYLLYGEEKYLVNMTLKKMKKKFGELMQGINFVVIDDTNVQDLIFNIEVPAFGFEKKLIIVKNSGLFKKDGRKKEPTLFQKEISDYLESHFSVIQEMVVLVFIEETVDKTRSV